MRFNENDLEEDNQGNQEFNQDNQENNQENQEFNQENIKGKRKQKKKTNYILTPARKAQIEKMNQARKKKNEEKRKSKELSTTDELTKNSDSSDETMIISGFDTCFS